jgi:hypothetical protein
VRLTALQSLVNAGPTGSSGFPWPRCRRGFSRDAWLHFLRRPPTLASRVHPLVSLVSSSEYCRFEPARRANASSAFLGVPVPHRGTNAGDPLATGLPPPTYGPSSAFRTPSTVYAHQHLVGLFHPTTTSRIHLPGAFPATKPVRLVDDPCPLVVRPRPLSRVAPRLQRRCPAFRALFQVAIRSSDAAV